MFDPVSISASVAVASTAFNGIKRAFQAGRDLEAMSQDLSRWMGAVSDVDNAHKSAKNPSLVRKVFGEIFNFVNEYESLPTHEVLVINFTEKKELTEDEVSKTIELLQEIKKSKDEDYEKIYKKGKIFSP